MFDSEGGPVLRFEDLHQEMQRSTGFHPALIDLRVGAITRIPHAVTVRGKIVRKLTIWTWVSSWGTQQLNPEPLVEAKSAKNSSQSTSRMQSSVLTRL